VRRIAVVVAFVAAALAASATPRDLDRLMAELQLVPMSGQAAPPFSLPALEGGHRSLADLRGRVALLYFWATWCPYCTAELPTAIEQLHRAYGRQGLAVVAINIAERRAEVAAWVSDQRLTLPILLDADGRTTLAYRVMGTPTAVIVGRNGALLGRAMGARGWTTPAGRALLEHLLAP
jgi:cytochrome c biogenesis protein CcmG/thiol:disulfide interchange protein DsbE